MTSKELKQLSRTDLLEMVLELRKENVQLRRDVEQLRSQLDDRILDIEQCGTLADAVLQLNGVFQAAEMACEQYTQNIQLRYANLESHCRQMEQITKEKCDAMLEQAKKEAADYISEAKQNAKERYNAYNWLRETIMVKMNEKK